MFPVILIFVLGGVFAAAAFQWFHRMPLRITPAEPDVIIAPADGVVWSVLEVSNRDETDIDKRFLGKIKTLLSDISGPRRIVSIFMSPLDAHANWMPVGGKVLSIRHAPGKFHYAKSEKSFLNEKNEILIETAGGPLKLIQIAGFLARRIDCWVKEGENVTKGEPFGMIRLGSQVTLVLPPSVSLSVMPGEKVRGGETILGRFSK